MFATTVWHIVIVVVALKFTTVWRCLSLLLLLHSFVASVVLLFSLFFHYVVCKFFYVCICLAKFYVCLYFMLFFSNIVAWEGKFYRNSIWLKQSLIYTSKKICYCCCRWCYFICCIFMWPSMQSLNSSFTHSLARWLVLSLLKNKYAATNYQGIVFSSVSSLFVP